MIMAEKGKKKEPAEKVAAKKKPAARKAAAKAGAEEEKREAAAEQPEDEKIEAAPTGEGPPQAPAGEEGDGLSEEEFDRLVEESLEKVTVTDIVLSMMNQIASVGYLKMGLPESVNLKYRDLDQSGLAIDTLEGMIKGAEGRVPAEALQPFKGTLANLQLNFVQLKQRLGKA